MTSPSSVKPTIQSCTQLLHLTDTVFYSPESISHGAFSTVYKGVDQSTGAPVAVKKCFKTPNSRNYDLKKVTEAEYRSLKRISDYKHAVKLLGMKDDSANACVWFVMEYCDRGDLESYVKATRPLTEDILKIVYQCACGVAYLHGLKPMIVHRDIKLTNFLCQTQDQMVIIKVADFGLSKIIDVNDAGLIELNSQVGCKSYLAPEVRSGTPYTEKVDVFSLGLVYYVLINTRLVDDTLTPVTGSGELVSQLLHQVQTKPSSPDVLKIFLTDSVWSKQLKELIRDMIQINPDQRPSMDIVRQRTSTLLQDYWIDNSIHSSQRVSSIHIDSSSDDSEFDSEDDQADVATQEEYDSQVATVSPRHDTAKGKQGTKQVDQDLTMLTRDKDDPTRIFYQTDESMTAGVYSLQTEVWNDKGVTKKIPNDKTRDQLDTVGQKRQDKILDELLGRQQTHVDHFTAAQGQQQFRRGDKVQLSADGRLVQQKQKKFGTWSSHLDKYLGCVGFVLEVRDEGFIVTFPNGRSLPLHSKLLVKVDSLAANDNLQWMRQLQFHRFDIVRVWPDLDIDTFKQLQKHHGGWHKDLKQVIGQMGAVNKVDRDGDVFVEFAHYNSFTINPLAIEKVDLGRVTLKVGDLAIVKMDRDLVKSLQGERWSNQLEKYLGHCSHVKSIKGSLVVLQISRVKWHQDCLIYMG